MAAERETRSLAERAAALGVLLVLVGGAAWGLLSPLTEAAAARAAAQERLARYDLDVEARGSAAPSYDPAEIAAAHVDGAEARLALQALIDRQARAVGLTVESLQPDGDEELGGVGRAAWLEVAVSGDLQAVIELIEALDRERPLVLLRAIEIEAGFGPRPDASVRARLEAGRAWRVRAP